MRDLKPPVAGWSGGRKAPLNRQDDAKNRSPCMNIPISILDLAPVPAGTTPSQALRDTVDLARLADRSGYVRYWFAEHHGMPSVASSAPEILIGHIAAATQNLRVGSGGIMLPNHSSLKVAELFRTLAALFPDRIDLGLGRAP